MHAEDLVFAKGYGGIRPQLIDKKKMALIMGEGKLQGTLLGEQCKVKGLGCFCVCREQYCV